MPAPKRRNISQQSEMIYDLHNFGVLLDTREIFLGCSDELEYEMIDIKVATNFIKNLRLLNSMGNDPILVHMNTCGGDWNYGMAIYDAIKACPCHMTVLAYAHARSMSSIIPQAADLRIMMPSADFLIHYGTFGLPEMNTQSAISEAEWAVKMQDHMMDLYAERCVEGQFFKREMMDKKAIKTYLIEKIAHKQEVYFTAREAISYGFMDAVLGDEGYENISTLREE